MISFVEGSNSVRNRTWEKLNRCKLPKDFTQISSHIHTVVGNWENSSWDGEDDNNKELCEVGYFSSKPDGSTVFVVAMEDVSLDRLNYVVYFDATDTHEMTAVRLAIMHFGWGLYTVDDQTIVAVDSKGNERVLLHVHPSCWDLLWPAAAAFIESMVEEKKAREVE